MIDGVSYKNVPSAIFELLTVLWQIFGKNIVKISNCVQNLFQMYEMDQKSDFKPILDKFDYILAKNLTQNAQ